MARPVSRLRVLGLPIGAATATVKASARPVLDPPTAGLRHRGQLRPTNPPLLGYPEDGEGLGLCGLGVHPGNAVPVWLLWACGAALRATVGINLGGR